MTKLKDLFAFKTKSSRKKTSAEEGKLEVDALPIDDNVNNHESIEEIQSNNNSEILPTTSMIMGENSSTSLMPSPTTSLVTTTHNTAVDNISSSGGAGSSGVMMAQGTGVVQQQVVMNISNVDKLHFGSVINIGANNTESNAKRPSIGNANRNTFPKTTTLVTMMRSNEEPSYRMLDTIATHLGEGWKSIMRELGHSDGQIEQALINHSMHGGIKEVIYQLLLDWIRNADDGVATVACITQILWNAKHRDCILNMKSVWKAEHNRKPSETNSS